jgi:ABC-type sugar transport system permease subunit
MAEVTQTMVRSAAPSTRNYLQELLPRIVLAPSFAAVLIFVYGFIIFTAYLSFTDSKMLPSFGWVGLENYSKLWALPHWWRAVSNLAIFGSLYIIVCSVLGLGLAILLDQKIRAEGVLRPIYLYPMGLGEFRLHLDQGQQNGDLHAGDRRGLAILGLRDGDVPRGPARCRQ